ncbi:ABC transporter permease [Paraburkholderia sp.]|uniref:ABC transporter permease n=1 Tax=Paraburkholderia sp. TaxID=1926495 RepID=UPI0039E37A88
MSRATWQALALPASLVVLAELAMRTAHVQSDVIAPPSAVVVAAWDALKDGTLRRATFETLGAALGGVLLGGLSGLALGIWFGLSRSAARLGAMSIEIFRPIPAVALMPIAMLVFGFGYRMEIATVGFACFWPVLLLTQAAVANVEPRLLEVARVLSLSPWRRVWSIVLPAALPRILVAFRLATGVALVVAVTVEIATNPFGLGYEMMNASQNLQPALTLALLVWVGLLGWSCNALMSAVERHGLRRFSGVRP